MGKRSGSGQERTRHAGDWLASFKDVALPWSGRERVRESSSSSDDEPPAEKPVAAKAAPEPADKPTEAPPAITRRMRRARRTRRRVVVAAVVGAVLVVCGAVAAVALVGRDSGTESSSRARTTAKNERAAVTTTAGPATAPPSAAPAPGPFTVRATCGGRACTVAVHEGSTTAGAKAGSLRNGEVVQVSCSTHGESVGDRDTGQRSDVWYRLDTGGYVSGLYLEGPTAPDCG